MKRGILGCKGKVPNFPKEKVLQEEVMEKDVMEIVMKPAQEKIEKIDQRLRIQPLRGGNLLYIT